MLLAIDIGNTQLFAGLFEANAQEAQILLRFRKSSKGKFTSDEYGLFLRSILRENGFDPDKITAISISSVVPDLLYSINSACAKYFRIKPLVLKSSVKTNVEIQVHEPDSVGADRIANTIATEFLYPRENKLIIDFGTATTYDVVTENSEWRGGLIAPGLRTCMDALSLNTAKLPQVEIQKPEVLVGTNTIENIQAGLYYGALGMAREVITRVHRDYFQNQSMRVIATGGFSYLFKGEDLFNNIEPDLVLIGLWRLHQINQ